jgi:thioesterase domain-containing protein/acyl carrier protein
MYGPTETTIWSSVHRVTRNDKAIPLGRPIANTQFYIVDAHGQPVPIGVRGELCIGGDGLARGYLNRPALTAEKFVTSAFSEAPGATIYKTGDLARYLPDGNIQFLGRLDHQVKIRGFRIELGEIDAALLQHPGVRAAAVTALANGPGEKELAAYWVAADTIPTNDELRTFLRTLLPDYMVPSIFVKLDSLPLSPSGKTDYKALPAPERGRDERLAYVAPRTADEEWLAALWREILRTDQVGVHDNFFTMGGHSLLATQVVLRINRSLNLHIPVRDLFEAGTIERLAQKVAAARRAGTRNNLPPIEPAPRERPVPMAYNQEPFWVSSNLQQGPAPYAFHPVMRIKGPLDTQALEEALGLIVRRHEPLRTTFVDDGNQIVQRIAPYEPWKLRVVDLSRLSDEDRETEVSRYAKAESDRPLDLVEGPLFRLEVLKLSNHEHVILVGRHHIIYDGWSLEVLSRELLTAYLASTAGFEPPLPELPVQYADFAAWQRARLEGDVLAHLTDYWRTQLAGLPVLDLPTDRPRPAARTTAGAACERVLPSRVASAIREFGKNSEATTFMALMAAYQILLHLTSRQDDFAVSTPVAGRLRPETENLIGCFMNDLVIRANLAGDPTFRQVMERVKGTVLNALDHQEMPFALLIKKLNPHRDPGRRTLVQTELIVHNVAPSGPPLPGLELSDLRSLTATEGADFELCLEVFDEPSSMQLRLCYQTDLFDASTIERLLRHFEKVLEAATAHPDTPLSQLGLPARSSLPHHRTNGAAPIVTNIPKHDSAPRSEVEHALVKLWSRHLRLDALEVNDDFFAKGGHSLAAVRMMTQARELFGIDVPIATFFARPTIAALARSIENGLGAQSRPAATSGLTMGTNGRHPPAPGPRSLVRLRAGGAAIPLFCIHGLGGHVASFWPLARGLGEERPVYGLQGRGLEAAEEPHRRIEAMARAYRSEIQQAQPRGPYLLAGWSMGGLIAIEIARQITAQGDDLALVAMLDTGFSVHEVSRRDMEDQAVLDWIAPRLNVSAVELKQMPLDQQWKWIAARAKLSEGDGIAEIRRLANVCLAHLAALADYDPEPFSGETVLFQTGCEASIQPRWPDVCPALRVELVGGNHYTMLKPPYVEDLAERLDRYLCGRKPARATVGAKLP